MSQPEPAGNGVLIFRKADIDRSNVDRENRSFPIVLVTETPVQTFDMQRLQVVDEVIHVAGMDMPGQVPMLDSHRDGEAAAVLGSIRELKRQNNTIVGRAYFSRDDASVKTFNDYVDGHRSDFSVGAKVLEADYEGNTRHVRRSRLKEGSAVLWGADPNAKAQIALRAYTDPQQLRDEVMYDKLRELLIKRGLKAEASDQEVLTFATAELNRTDAKDDEKKELAEILRSLKDAPKPPAAAPSATPLAAPAVSEADILTRERKRLSDIETICRQHEGRVTAEDRQKWINDGATGDQVARAVLDRLVPKSEPTGGAPLHISGGMSEREKIYSAVSDSLVQRCLSGQGLNPRKGAEAAKKINDIDAIQRSERLNRVFEKPAAGHEQFHFMGLFDIARMFLEKAGHRVDGLPRADIARRAMMMGKFCDITRGDGPAFHTSGSFSSILMDASNKTLQAAYQEAPSTWETWARRAPSVADFKTINRTKFGVLPNPEEIPENGRYPDVTTSDAKESYAVTKKGMKFSTTWEAVVNDDLNAISRTPASLGNACRRRVNADVYAVLTANAAMADGNALFSTAHLNGANNPINATGLNALFTAMSIQTALGSTAAILNLTPKYLVIPQALAATAWGMLNSIADPNAGGSAAGNSNTKNMYGPGGPRGLEIVADGVLDGASTAIWYGLADPSQIDTVEVTFLQGNEAPVLESETGFETDTLQTKVRHVYKAAAIDHRGAYRGGTTVS